MVTSGKKMFKFRKCTNDTITYYQRERYRTWCSAKLPCGRCVSMEFEKYKCEYILENQEFDCDNCPHKFKCLTNGNEYEDHKWVKRKRSD